VLTFEGKCSYLRAKSAHLVGHLPTLYQSLSAPPGMSTLRVLGSKGTKGALKAFQTVVNH